ncbi:MAG TPA: dipeptidyl aminopeptidase [Rhodoglobus sp.]|nr:dipeptidyl aminopeptidase [Rhodoglobus sp.]
MSLGYDFARPHQVFTAGFFRDRDLDFATRGLLGLAASGATEPGEVLAAVATVKEGDPEGWFTTWRDLGLRLQQEGDALRSAGRLAGAAAAYLRASAYLSTALNAAGDDEVLGTFRAHRAAWDGFIDTTVVVADRIDIPYEGTTLPGYLLLASEDEEPRPTIVLNNGSDASHTELWGQAAHGALARGYNVLFFDGPGQQSMLFERGVPFRPDWEAVLTPVVDHLLASNDVLPDQLAVVGLSQAGYWVPRALAFEHRFAAAIADPGVVDVSASWLPHIPAPVRAAFERGDRPAFEEDLAVGFRFDKAAARAWTFRARPYGQPSAFDTLTEVVRYRLTPDILARITTPLYITSPEDEQFWPGQSQQLADGVEDATVQPFTTAEGANLHVQPLARTLTQQRMYDWLDARLGR